MRKIQTMSVAYEATSAATGSGTHVPKDVEENWRVCMTAQLLLGDKQSSGCL